jgi:predicted CXXCH cytochrome family protein
MLPDGVLHRSLTPQDDERGVFTELFRDSWSLGVRPVQWNAVSSVANVCGACHVLFAELYNKSPHQPAFAAMDAGGCVVCHSNHGIQKPSVQMLAGSQAVCAQCHDAASEGGKAATEIAGMLNQLTAALDRSDQILTRAHRSGMEVGEAQRLGSLEMRTAG